MSVNEIKELAILKGISGYNEYVKEGGRFTLNEYLNEFFRHEREIKGDNK